MVRISKHVAAMAHDVENADKSISWLAVLNQWRAQTGAGG